MTRANINLFFFSLLLFILINNPFNIINKNSSYHPVIENDEMIEKEKEAIVSLKLKQSFAYLSVARSIDKEQQPSSTNGDYLNFKKQQEMYTESDLNELIRIKNTKFIFIRAQRSQLINDSLIEYIKSNYANVLCSPKLPRNFYSFLNIISQFKNKYQSISFMNYDIIDSRSLMFIYSYFSPHLDKECTQSNIVDEITDTKLQMESYYSYLSYLYPKSKFIYIYDSVDTDYYDDNDKLILDNNKKKFCINCININSNIKYSNKEIDELLK